MVKFSGRTLFEATAKFYQSAPTLTACPNHRLPEVAFSGRSNVGKSSLINALTRSEGKKKLALVAKTPGRTQMLNFFQVGRSVMLVDLPGYGFAKAPKDVVETWTRLNEDFLLTRGEQLVCTVVMIDSRRGVLPIDFEWMCMLREGGVRFKVALTKSDRCKEEELVAAVAACRLQYEKVCGGVARGDVLVTSAKTGDGIAALKTA
eukprot:CAMPEP_0174950440 /NCGR_PEP_ID=MMETSP1355-20121228/94125_1 /TAXON_ID=464990 /ORGANISM="Hemiselmis tepida, Strain CCMP443" /LENGTH=204 /DNA_ID=CAMNT_0016198049 /DNA_START=147 /DNA_END=757 /DNA_ORIENTATION=-